MWERGWQLGLGVPFVHLLHLHMLKFRLWVWCSLGGDRAQTPLQEKLDRMAKTMSNPRPRLSHQEHSSIGQTNGTFYATCNLKETNSSMALSEIGQFLTKLYRSKIAGCDWKSVKISFEFYGCQVSKCSSFFNCWWEFQVRFTLWEKQKEPLNVSAVVLNHPKESFMPIENCLQITCNFNIILILNFSKWDLIFFHFGAIHTDMAWKLPWFSNSFSWLIHKLNIIEILFETIDCRACSISPMKTFQKISGNLPLVQYYFGSLQCGCICWFR